MKRIRSALRYALPLALLLGTVLVPTTPALADDWEYVGHSAVFSSGEDGYYYYRTPGSIGHRHAAAHQPCSIRGPRPLRACGAGMTRQGRVRVLAVLARRLNRLAHRSRTIERAMPITGMFKGCAMG